MSQFTFGKFTGEIDTQDYAFQAKMENRYQELSESIAKLPKDGKRSDYILNYCRSVFSFFNALFGEGTDKKMFGESTNMRVCDDAVYALSLAITADLEDYKNYSIQQNQNVESSLKALEGQKPRRSKSKPAAQNAPVKKNAKAGHPKSDEKASK